jgi:tyrosyl-tRNA synthetase
MPDEMPAVSLAAGPEGLPISNLLKEAGLVSSTTDARRMIKQGAVKIDGERVEDIDLKITAGTKGVFQVGKRRFARVSLTP